MVDTSVLALIVVGIIGYCILNKSDGGAKMLTWTDVGKILLIFAIVEGLMYLVAPLPIRTVCTKPAVTIEGMIFGGGGCGCQDTPDNLGVGGSGIIGGSVLDSIR